MVQDPQGFGESTKRGRFFEGPEKGPLRGEDRGSFCLSLRVSWLRELVCARHWRNVREVEGEVPVPRAKHT
jgi:hypothetical protein